MSQIEKFAMELPVCPTCGGSRVFSYNRACESCAGSGVVIPDEMIETLGPILEPHPMAWDEPENFLATMRLNRQKVRRKIGEVFAYMRNADG